MSQLFRLLLATAFCLAPAMPSGIVLEITRQWDRPVIDNNSPGAEGNQHGFEGGCVRKLNGVYHLFTSEMSGQPRNVKMRLAHWTSRDRLHWQRRATLYESSGERTGSDPRAALWAPMPVYDPDERRWNLFYVAYRAPVGPDGWHGRLWRAVSRTPGPDGIDGPWQDVGIILEPGPESQPWEGSQGTDSIFVWPAGGRWLGFYGSSNAKDYWSVGLISAPSIGGPWRRLAKGNPTTFSGALGTENPIVTPYHGRYLAVFDTIRKPDVIGYSESPDGIHWEPARQFRLKKTSALWVQDVRTPLGLIDEGKGVFTLFYTGFARIPSGISYGCVGLLEVRIAQP